MSSLPDNLDWAKALNENIPELATLKASRLLELRPVLTWREFTFLEYAHSIATCSDYEKIELGLEITSKDMLRAFKNAGVIYGLCSLCKTYPSTKGVHEYKVISTTTLQELMELGDVGVGVYSIYEVLEKVQRKCAKLGLYPVAQ